MIKPPMENIIVSYGQRALAIDATDTEIEEAVLFWNNVCVNTETMGEFALWLSGCSPCNLVRLVEAESVLFKVTRTTYSLVVQGIRRGGFSIDVSVILAICRCYPMHPHIQELRLLSSDIDLLISMTIQE